MEEKPQAGQGERLEGLDNFPGATLNTLEGIYCSYNTEQATGAEPDLRRPQTTSGRRARTLQASIASMTRSGPPGTVWWPLTRLELVLAPPLGENPTGAVGRIKPPAGRDRSIPSCHRACFRNGAGLPHQAGENGAGDRRGPAS